MLTKNEIIDYMILYKSTIAEDNLVREQLLTVVEHIKTLLGYVHKNTLEIHRIAANNRFIRNPILDNPILDNPILIRENIIVDNIVLVRPPRSNMLQVVSMMYNKTIDGSRVKVLSLENIQFSKEILECEAQRIMLANKKAENKITLSYT